MAAPAPACPLIAAAARILAVATGATTPPRAEDLALIAEEVSAMRILVARARKSTERTP